MAKFIISRYSDVCLSISVPLKYNEISLTNANPILSVHFKLLYPDVTVNLGNGISKAISCSKSANGTSEAYLSPVSVLYINDLPPNFVGILKTSSPPHL